MRETYQPEEDSYFLSEFVKLEVQRNSSLKVLDMGSGSGIQAKIALKFGVPEENITLVDINKKSIRSLKKDFQNSNIINSDLFKNVKGKFDLIIFNPPYLPKDKYDKETDTTGGEKGSEVINDFLKQAKFHLTKKGRVLLLTSSLTKDINWKDFKKELLGTKNLFFEKLFVWKIKKYPQSQ